MHFAALQKASYYHCVILFATGLYSIFMFIGVRLWNDALNVTALQDDSLFEVYQSLGRISVDFLNKGERYDPTINKEELFKASRLEWFMVAFQMQQNLPLALTDSMFGYSMLYPYTDDLVDCNDMSRDAKKDFAQVFS